MLLPDATAEGALDMSRRYLSRYSGREGKTIMKKIAVVKCEAAVDIEVSSLCLSIAFRGNTLLPPLPIDVSEFLPSVLPVRSAVLSMPLSGNGPTAAKKTVEI